MEAWRPQLGELVPPGKGRKYALYGAFDVLGLFKSGRYRQVTGTVAGVPACSALLLPGHFRFPFMKRDDVQITYVMTAPAYRGQGLAWQLLYRALADHDHGDLWYVTDRSNVASQHLAAKAGLSLVGTARRGRTPIRRLVMT